ncbi:down syndrome cell adhesion molecule-like protein Dscam2 [Caerostris extrusa]|uniref:Down syndrome cell adhesion molecule-like protein Dscam2 n=1 Tax=Caerostris extrusa TaxID=172846 RepID=A0AAV4UY30_CAEEX|nr:down syndrome cell adhesion molecule-like protein Dscam2 [Caerostris extrusa]
MFLCSSLLFPYRREQTSTEPETAGFPNGTLIINNVDRTTDEGSYRCIAENKEGESAFRDVGVKVLVAPVINPFHFPPNLKEGNRVIIKCARDGR